MSLPGKAFEDIFKSGYWEGQQKFTDGTLQTEDGTTFEIHRVILTQHSRYFRVCFSLNLKRSKITIPNVDSKILEAILLFIYTGKTTMDENTVWNVMIAADFLLLDDLLGKCRFFAMQNMTTKNCISWILEAEQIKRLSIKYFCYRYAIVHFKDILESSSKGLEKLAFADLKELLKSNSLNVSSERLVWKAIVLWTNADNSTRLSLVPALLSCLKLEAGSDEELAKEILSHSIVSNNPHCFDLIEIQQSNNCMSECILLSQFAISNQNSPSLFRPRFPNDLYIIARHTVTTTKYGSDLYLTIDNELDFWRLIGETDFIVDTMVQIGQLIYMFNTRQNLNRIFDIVDQVFLPISIPHVPCKNGGIIAINEQLYSIGGSRNIVYHYEFETNQWKSLNMVYPIVIQGAVTLKGLMYILGMSEIEPATILVCLAYNPETSYWNWILPPNVYRRGFSVVVFHDQIYVVGGESDEGYLKSVEVYNPTTAEWISLPDLPFQYLVPKAVVVDDKIIIHENNNEYTRYHKVTPPVYWDADAQIWRILGKSSPLNSIERYSFLLLNDRQLVKDITAQNRGTGKQNQILRV